MQPERELAIVLRSIQYQERHRVVTAITENRGLLTALARNSIQSRRFGGCLELFTASEWHFARKEGAEMAHLQQALIKRGYEGLRKDWERMTLASALSEILLRVAPVDHAAPDLFRLHSNALALIESPEADTHTVTQRLAILNGYLSKLLQWSGTQPRMSKCLECETSLEDLDPSCSLNVVLSDAGWICPRCRANGTRHVQNQTSGELLRVSARAIRDYHSAVAAPIRQIPTVMQGSEADHRELFSMLEGLFVYHIPGFDKTPIRSLRFLNLESSLPPAPSHPQ